MKRFGFVVHPITHAHVRTFFPPARFVSDAVIERVLRLLPPFPIDSVQGIRSATGEEVEGLFIVCPLLAKQILSLPEDFVIRKVLAAVRRAQREKACIIGLGALAGTVGEGGSRIAAAVEPSITNGTTFAGCACVETILRASVLRRLDISLARIAVIGATNAIGKIVVHTFREQAAQLALVARNQERLTALCRASVGARAEAISYGTDADAALEGADIAVFTTTAIEVSPHVVVERLKPGAIICDIPTPRNISQEMAQGRPDLLVLDGAAIEPPFPFRLRMETGLAPGQIYACMAETIVLALEGREGDFSFGFEPSPEKVREICALAHKHGFKPAFTSFGRKIT